MSASRDSSGPASVPPFRFVHCSDVHLDAPFAIGHDETRGRLSEETRATVARLVDLCLAEQAHALVVAGDLFDDERLALDTEDWLVAQFSRLTQAGITVVLGCGNHDSAAPGGRMGAVAFPEGVHVAGGEPLVLDVRDASGAVVGRIVAAGHGSAHETARLAASLPVAEEDVASVAVVHGFVDGARGAGNHEPLAPCGPDDFAAVGHRYWALGHVHERQQIGKKPVAHYPGCLVPHGFLECGPRGALLVSLPARGEPKVEFRPLCAVRFERLVPEGLPELRDLAGLRAACVRAFEALRATETREGVRWMLRFELSGPCAAAAEVQRLELLEELGDELSAALAGFAVLRAEVLDMGVTRPVDLAAHAGRPHLLGEALAVAAALDDAAVLDRLAPAPAAGAEAQSDKRAYVASLLADMDRAAAQALIREDRP